VIASSLQEWATATPAVVALEWPRFALTYGDFFDLVSEARGALMECGAQPGCRVGLLAGNSPEVYVGYAAIAATGASVVPLSITQPRARLADQIRRADISLVTGSITDTEILRHADGSKLCRVGLGIGASPVPVGAHVNPRPIPSVETEAYVLYTSGSTGRPKGVRVARNSVELYIEAAVMRYGFAVGDRLSHNFDLTFDLSVFDMLCSWTTGATLVIPGQRERYAVGRYVSGRELTSNLHVPSAITLALRRGELKPDSLPVLRWSLFAGETLHLKQAALWNKAASGSVIENLYGPTELTISCSAYRLPGEEARWPLTSNGSVPIGSMATGHDYVVVGDAERDQRKGELWVRGPQRALGYLDPADAHGRFVEDSGASPAASELAEPPARCFYRTGDIVSKTNEGLVFLGRRDRQVKINGYRVELAEVETVANQHPGIIEAGAVAASTGALVLTLFAVVKELDAVAVRYHLAARLPRHAVPRRIEIVERLPLTANGKIDYGDLAARVIRQDQEQGG